MNIRKVGPTSVSPACFEPKKTRAEAVEDRFLLQTNQKPAYGSKGIAMVYEAVIQRNGGEIQTLYWNGSLQDTVNLARAIALKCEADRFRIIEFAHNGAEVHSEEVASLNNRQ
jgi:hypothetical protein